MKKKKKWIIDISLVVIIFVMGFLVFWRMDRLVEFFRGWSQEPSSESTASSDIETLPTSTPATNEEEQILLEAPDFQLVNLEGDMVALSDHRGSVVLVNFWATWCPPCRAEMPLLQEFADRYDQDMVVFAVNSGEEEAVVRNFVETTGLNLLFLLDPTNSVATLYRVRGFPTSLFIDENGILQATHIGELDETLLLSYLKKVGVAE